MLRFTRMAGAVLASLLITECDPIEEATANCSGTETGTSEFNSHNVSHTELIGSQRHYSWTFDLSNLCVASPSSQNSVTFKVFWLFGAPYPIQAQGFVQPAYGYEPYETHLFQADQNPDTWTETISGIGLRQGSQDGEHGYANVLLTIAFPTKGSLALDNAAVDNTITLVRVSWSFKHLDP